MWFSTCPRTDQGLLRPMVTESGAVILFCDEADHVWLHPEHVGTVEPYVPREPDWVVVEGVHVRPGTNRWATWDDLAPLGWDVDWHPGPSDHPD